MNIIQTEIQNSKDEHYVKFSSSIVPGKTDIFLRVPVAKQLARPGYHL